MHYAGDFALRKKAGYRAVALSRVAFLDSSVAVMRCYAVKNNLICLKHAKGLCCSCAVRRGPGQFPPRLHWDDQLYVNLEQQSSLD